MTDDGHSSWKDLGEETKNLIYDAVTTGNFENLSYNVGNIAGRAFRKLTDVPCYERQYRSPNESAWEQMPPQQTYTQQVPAQPRTFYVNKIGARIGATVGTAVGFGLGVLLFTIFGTLALVGGSGLSLIMLILCVIPAVSFLIGGVSAGALRRIRRYDGYVRELGDRTYMEVPRLAQTSGKSEKYTLKDLRWMISHRWFRQGHIDERGKTLITSDEMYREYLELQRRRQESGTQTNSFFSSPDAASQTAETKATEPKEDGFSESQREIFSQGEAYIREIHQCNDEIPGEEISAKIDRMEHSVRMIIERAKQRPALTDDLRRLMNYYLPTTVKLLHAYADLDSQGKSSANIEKSKREIEGTIDTLNDAFDKIFDDMFEDTSLDISTDIEVMRNMLEREGLS